METRLLIGYSLIGLIGLVLAFTVVLIVRARRAHGRRMGGWYSRG